MLKMETRKTILDDLCLPVSGHGEKEILNLTCEGNVYIDLTKDTFKINWYLYSDFEIILIAIVMPFILIIGLLGNILFVLTVVKVESMRTITNCYLLNLAIADSCFLTVAVGEKLYGYMVNGVPGYGSTFGTAGCVLLYTGIFVPFFAALILITFSSLERYYAVCKPIRHLAIWQKKYTVRLVVISWSLSVILTATILPGFVPIVYSCIVWPEDDTYRTFPGKVSSCAFIGYNADNPNKSNMGAVIYANIAQTLPFFVAMTTNTIVYINIMRTINASNSRIGRNSFKNSTSRKKSGSGMTYMRTRNHINRMLMATCAIFFLCEAPYQLACLAMVIQAMFDIDPTGDTHTKVSDILLWVSRLLLYINSAINPYIYIITNSRYRKSLSSVLALSSKRKRTTPTNRFVQR